NNSTTTSLKEGAIIFKTDSLDKDLSVDKNQNFSVAFSITVDVTQGNPHPYDYVRVNLTITVLEDGTECASAKYEGDKVYLTTETTEYLVSKDLSFVEGWDYKFDKGDVFKVRITPEIEEHDVKGAVTDISLVYTAYMEYDNKDLPYPGVLSNVHCSPVEITLSTYDKDNKQVDEFMPNLAPEDCIIKFSSAVKYKNAIKNAFDDDITEVNIEIRGPNNFYCKPENNITENKTKEELYKWDYSKYSKNFVADKQYTANVTVTTVQGHIFYQTTNFTFSAYGLEAKIDNDVSASETITAGNQTDYTISIRNAGSSDKETDVKITLIISVSPLGLHEWNITLADKSIETNTTGSFMHEFFNFQGGDTKSLILTAKSLNVTGEVGDYWDCSIKITIEFVGTPEIKDLFSTTHLAPPHKIDINWSKTLDDPCYVLVDVSSSLSIDVTNMGSLPDTVDLTLNYTNYGVWDITFKNGWKNTTTEKLNPYRYTLGGYEEEVKLIIIASSEGENEATISVNITACSQGNKSVRDYLTLNLSRAFGIKPLSVESQGSESVDVKDSSGQVIYEVSIKTNDNTTHTVDLNAVCNNENIDVGFDDDSVAVSKDSPKNVTLTVTCPKGMLAGSYTITVNASIRGAPVSKHNKTANVIVTVNEYYALSVVWAESNKNNITVTAAPGEYFYRTLRVTNKGNSNISVSIDPVNVHDFQLFDSAVPSQFSLSYGEEKNVTIYLYIPKDARDGDTFVVYMETSGAGSPKSAVITIEIKQDIWDKLIATLYSMIYFIILLIAVVVVFISVWVKKKKMR
ncbi:MAG: hypothetical protein KJ655_05415, partial [Candidatus Thermoplasmatota archaeon]|nr:hypothetical protein [Candidatus Thermoplasmatota archaeon]